MKTTIFLFSSFRQKIAKRRKKRGNVAVLAKQKVYNLLFLNIFVSCR